MPLFIELHTDGKPRLFALHDIGRIADHYILSACTGNIIHVDESYQEMRTRLDDRGLILGGDQNGEEAYTGRNDPPARRGLE